jgi:tRNA (cytidine/uridine-2'-O-)-methyltransferase
MSQQPSGSSARLEAPALTVVLVEPQIPPNTGNIARLCAASGCHLVLVGQLGFRLDDAALRRAGLDYWEHVSWEYRPSLEDFLEGLPPPAFHLLTTHARAPYTHLPAVQGDCLFFGKETAGLPKSLLERYPQQCYTIPIVEPGVRSLNLSSAVAIVLYDALRRVRPFPAG